MRWGWEKNCGGRRARALRTGSPGRTVPAWTTRALKPRSRSSLPSSEFTNATASSPKRARNFAQPLCGFLVTSMTAPPASGSPIASREPVGRLVVEMSRSTKSWSPASACSAGLVGEQRHHAGAHHVELGLEVAALGDRVGGGPGEPVVADQPVGRVEPGLGEDLSLVHARPAYDEGQGAPLGGCGAQVVEGGGELGDGRGHGSILAPPGTGMGAHFRALS